MARARRVLWCVPCKAERIPLAQDGTCGWCDQHHWLEERPRKRGGGKPKGKYGRLTPRQVRAAHQLYVEKELSCNQLGRLLWKRFGYGSVNACSNSLWRSFKELGLPTRSQRAVTIKRNLKHGRKRRDLTPEEDVAYRRWLQDQRGWGTRHGPGQPQCKGSRVQSPRKGERCDRPAKEDSDYCPSHDPARELERQAHLARVRRRWRENRELVPLEPFAAWVEQLVDAAGAQEPIAERLGCSRSTVSHIVRRVRSAPGGRVPWTEFDRRRVERYLERAGGPAIEDLYGEIASPQAVAA